MKIVFDAGALLLLLGGAGAGYFGGWVTGYNTGNRDGFRRGRARAAKDAR